MRAEGHAGSVLGTLAGWIATLDHALSSHPVARRLYPNYYARTKARNWAKRKVRPAAAHSFVFILCPPYAGSTLLDELLSTSPGVSCNHERGNREGQRLPEARPLMWDCGRDARWDEHVRYDWIAIRRIWMKYWDVTKPLLLEKSPPNLIRASELQAHFDPSYFVCVVRNPYAHCESLMRRAGSTAGDAAAFSVRCLMHQRRNVEGLERVLLVRYEDLVRAPEDTCRRLVQFIPGLRLLDHARMFGARNYLGRDMPITDLNAHKIARLARNDLEAISGVLRERRDVLGYFGYEPL